MGKLRTPSGVTSRGTGISREREQSAITWSRVSKLTVTGPPLHFSASRPENGAITRILRGKEMSSMTDLPSCALADNLLVSGESIS